jgi:hypothetical protein
MVESIIIDDDDNDEMLDGQLHEREGE